MSANVIQKIDTQLGELPPDSLRFQILLALKKFRASWVNLGKHLTDVAYGGDYKEWGYDDFEVYCASELGLKKPTVKKLMVGYNYMKSYEPERLVEAIDNKGATLPDADTVKLLWDARGRADIEEEDKEELHRFAFESGIDQQVIRKEIKARIKPKELFSDTEMEQAGILRTKEIKAILTMSRKLRDRLYEAKSVPEGIVQRAEKVLLELEALG